MKTEEREPSIPGSASVADAVNGDERFRRLLEDLRVGVLVQGPRSEVLFANGAAAELLGLSQQDLLGKTSLDATPLAVREDGSPFPGEEHPGPLALASGKAVRDVVVGFLCPSRKDRVWLLVNADPQLGPDGSVVRVIVTLSDITALRQAEERLRESESRYRQLVEKAQDIIYETDVQGYFTYVNPVASRIMACPAEDLVGKHFLELVRPDHRQRVNDRLVEQFRRRTPTTYDEFVAVARDGREIWIGQNVQLLVAADRVLGFQAVARDITERRRAEEALEKARETAREASRLKSVLLANMGHELRTPLNGVLGMVRLLLDTSLRDRQREYAHTIESSARDLLSMINGILEYTELEAGEIELSSVDFDPRVTVREAIDAFSDLATTKGLRLTGDVSDSVPPLLRGDPTRLGQVLSHLVDNAVKFTDAGEVVLRARFVESAGVDRLRFEVRDTGIGVPPAALDHVFEPFYQADSSTTRRHRGTGLGLAIAKRLVEALGGEIGVKSGAGSTFYFVVPVERLARAVARQAEPPGARAAPETRPCVLVVEDHPVNQKVTVAMLENLGYRVEVASNGLEAAEACARTVFDAILMDCQMPEMDGFKATAWIREREGSARRTPIIALTASVMPRDRETCLAAGMDDYLTKPVRLRILDETLRKWISKEAPAVETRPAAAAPASTLPPDHPLRVLEAQGRAEVVGQIIDLFLETTPLRLEALRILQARGDASAIVSAAHSLKGACVQLGARAMADLCTRIQSAAREGDLEEAGTFLEALGAEYAGVRRLLETESERLGE